MYFRYIRHFCLSTGEELYLSDDKMNELLSKLSGARKETREIPVAQTCQ